MTFKFAVVGDPVSHSLSPPMHSAALAAAGLEGSYVRLECDEPGFLTAVSELRAGEWSGFNVTMPHKFAAFLACDLTTREGERAGSVNTMKMSHGMLLGHSSDVVAFRVLLALPEFGGRPVHVLGSGGSAAAALAACSGEAFVASRNRDAARALVARFEGLSVTPIEWGAPVPDSILINATPIGMHGESVPPGVLEVAAALIDLPYGPAPTPAVGSVRSSGRAYSDGYRFLALQAAESFLWWTGHEAEVSVMEAAARNG